MLRTVFGVLGLSLALTAAGGCRSCDACHDYDPPVANCDCNACGMQRAGSATYGQPTSSGSSNWQEMGTLEPTDSGNSPTR